MERCRGAQDGGFGLAKPARWQGGAPGARELELCQRLAGPDERKAAFEFGEVRVAGGERGFAIEG
jgi:hypothetical protein